MLMEKYEYDQQFSSVLKIVKPQPQFDCYLNPDHSYSQDIKWCVTAAGIWQLSLRRLLEHGVMGIVSYSSGINPLQLCQGYITHHNAQGYCWETVPLNPKHNFLPKANQVKKESEWINSGSEKPKGPNGTSGIVSWLIILWLMLPPSLQPLWLSLICRAIICWRHRVTECHQRVLCANWWGVDDIWQIHSVSHIIIRKCWSISKIKWTQRCEDS